MNFFQRTMAAAGIFAAGYCVHAAPIPPQPDKMIPGANAQNNTLGGKPYLTEDKMTSSLRSSKSGELNLATYLEFSQKVRLKDREVRVWDAAFSRALNDSDEVYVPDLGEPYYISQTIVLKSGKSLRLDPKAEIRAMPGMRTTLLRNATPLPGNQLPEPQSIPPDHNIRVSGGIWNASCDENPKSLCCYDLEDSITGMSGALEFTNVRDLTVSDLEIRNAVNFCIQMSNAQKVEISGITFRDSKADGLHMNGPLKNIRVHHLVNEGTGDDFVSLNAWDWVHAHVTAGPIEDVILEHCECRSGYNSIRMLSGVKHYFDGTTRDCFIRDVIIRDLHGVQNFKMYAQGLAGTQEKLQVGKLERIYFKDIFGLKKLNRIPFDPPYYGQKDRTAPFEILANSDDLVFENLHGDFDFSENPVVIAVGPLAFTGSREGEDPFFAKEVFPAHLSCVVKNLTIGPVFGRDGVRAKDPAKLVKAFELAPRPDFVPGKHESRGGTGSGRILNLVAVP